MRGTIRKMFDDKKLNISDLVPVFFRLLLYFGCVPVFFQKLYRYFAVLAALAHLYAKLPLFIFLNYIRPYLFPRLVRGNKYGLPSRIKNEEYLHFPVGVNIHLCMLIRK